jgi:AraC family transcriptional regulator
MSPTPGQDESDNGRAVPDGAIARLIESSAASFETDPDSSRRYLLRAAALLRSRSMGLNGPEGRSVHAQPCPRLLGWQINRLLSYIDSNLTATIRGKQLADLTGLSVGHLSRAFKMSVGIPPTQYIARQRIERACELMLSGTESVRQIAGACGFPDASQFCRVFRRVVGQTATAWRRANSTGPRSPKANA